MAEAIDTGCRWRVTGYQWLLTPIGGLCVGELRIYLTQREVNVKISNHGGIEPGSPV